MPMKRFGEEELGWRGLAGGGGVMFGHVNGGVRYNLGEQNPGTLLGGATVRHRQDIGGA